MRTTTRTVDPTTQLPPVADDVVVVPWLELVRRGLVPAVPTGGPGELAPGVAEFCRANRVTVRQADNLGPALAASDVARLELARHGARVEADTERAEWDAFVAAHHHHRGAAVREAAAGARADLERQAATTFTISEMDIRQAEENAREAARAAVGPLPSFEEWHAAGRPTFEEWNANTRRRVA
jgi:hypothetical protein